LTHRWPAWPRWPRAPAHLRTAGDVLTQQRTREGPRLRFNSLLVLRCLCMRVIHGARREATCTTLLLRRGYSRDAILPEDATSLASRGSLRLMQSPKCTIVLVYPHAEKVPSPTSLLLQYVRCASNHHYVWWFRECRASPCAAPSCLARVFVVVAAAHCRRRQHRATHAGQGGRGIYAYWAAPPSCALGSARLPLAHWLQQTLLK
jgi:hypothetical protein